MEQQPNYLFYATLLDKFSDYLNSSAIYQEYWGYSEEPEFSEEEFEKKQFQSLIDTINRVPFESEKADKGTAFNEVVDCLIDNRKSDKMEMSVVDVKGVKVVRTKYKTHTFDFNLQLCQEFAKYFEGALTQQRTEGILPTKYGNVLLYGYIDQLMPFKIADTKTTSKYKAFKFINNWQHNVYPYCLSQEGIDIPEFEYRVTDFKATWSEFYNYDAEIVIPKLIEHCELIIEFIEQNKHLITNKKIFGIMEENIETHEAEETTETPSAGAIEVGEGKGLVKFEETIVIPAIPKTLIINGVEVNNDQLKEKIAEIKAMKITDDKTLEKAKEELKTVAKLRTTTESWRTKTMKPVLKLQKDLKAQTDETGTLCADGEKHLNNIISDYENATEKARLLEMNKERTDNRKEILELKGFEYVEVTGSFQKGDIEITEDMVLSLDAEEWKLAINPPVSAPSAIQPSPAFESEAPVEGESSIGLGSTFTTPTSTQYPNAVFDNEGVMISTGIDKYGIRLPFTEDKPSIQFQIGNNFNIVLYNKSLENKLPEINSDNSEEIEGNLWFALIQTK